MIQYHFHSLIYLYFPSESKRMVLKICTTALYCSMAYTKCHCYCCESRRGTYDRVSQVTGKLLSNDVLLLALSLVDIFAGSLISIQQIYHAVLKPTNHVKWRTSRLVSDSVLPRLHHWSSAALDYPPSGTEPFRLPLLLSGTVYHSTSLLHFCCLSFSHTLRLTFLLFPIPYLLYYIRYLLYLSPFPYHACAVTLVILDILIVHVTYLLLLWAS